ncbi:MAG TPA: ABC transporter permease [Bryobacteraceae bacterium]|jgi:predicted permease|nr:ABC transporter permease [Bryobacteraceae bacterium]
MRDFRYALRQLFRTPGFTAVAILTLALGIGANAAIFSVMNALLLRYLPAQDPASLVYLHTTGNPNGSSQTGYGDTSLTMPIFEQLRKQKDVFSDIVAYVPLSIGKVAVRYGKEPQEAAAEMVSGNFFTMLGVLPAAGRTFNVSDEAAQSSVAVLSYACWTRQFGRDRSVIGQPLYIKDVPFTIIGVAAPAFIGLDREPMDVWIPFQDRAELLPWGRVRRDGSSDSSLYHSPNWWFLLTMGRLAPGVSQQQALARSLPTFQNAAYSALGRPKEKEVLPKLFFTSARGVAGAGDSYEMPLKVLMAMVLLVLAIACANVSLLLVARNAARQREFSLRMALGGSRVDLFKQLLTESLLLVSVGAGLGWFFANWATHALAAWSDMGVSLTPDVTVLWFTLAVSLTAALVFGLAPLRSVLRIPIGLALKTSAATAHRDRARNRGAQTVITLQMALCIVLLVTAGLLVRTLRNLESVNLGMNAHGLLVFGVSPLQRVNSDSESNRFFLGLLTRLRALPGVQAVTLMGNRIGSGWSNNTGAEVDGQPPLGTNTNAPMRWNAVGSDYFHTLDIPVVLGRDFNDADSESAPRVAIVNQTFANKYLSGRTPLGHQVDLNPRPDGQFTIVGVAADSKYTDVEEKPRPMAFFPYTQLRGNATLHFEVRTAGDPASWMPTVRRAVNDYAPGLALLSPMTQQAEFDSNFSDQRIFFRLSMFFGLLAAMLVATGLYGTLAYSVSRRTSEVGLRMALGAQRGQVLWMVLRGSLLMTVVGVVLGIPVALLATKFLRAILFGVEPRDPAVFAAAIAGIAVVSLGASLIPAVRAASVDPMIALREE